MSKTISYEQLQKQSLENEDVLREYTAQEIADSFTKILSVVSGPPIPPPSLLERIRERIADWLDMWACKIRPEPPRGMFDRIVAQPVDEAKLEEWVEKLRIVRDQLLGRCQEVVSTERDRSNLGELPGKVIKDVYWERRDYGALVLEFSDGTRVRMEIDDWRELVIDWLVEGEEVPNE